MRIHLRLPFPKSVSGLLLLAAGALFSACSGPGSQDPGVEGPEVAVPEILSPEPVYNPDYWISDYYYEGPVEITLRSATAGATIHYTLDGTAAGPNSPVYTSPLRIDRPETGEDAFEVLVRAVAIKDGVNSGTAERILYFLFPLRPPLAVLSIAGAQAILIGWESSADYFMVGMATDPTGTWTWRDAADRKSFVWEGLVPGTRYYFKVTGAEDYPERSAESALETILLPDADSTT